MHAVTNEQVERFRQQITQFLTIQMNYLIIYVMWQRPRADNLTICCRKKTLTSVFHGPVAFYLRWNKGDVYILIQSYFDNDMTKFIVNNRTDAKQASIGYVVNTKVFQFFDWDFSSQWSRFAGETKKTIFALFFKTLLKWCQLAFDNSNC